MISDWRAGKPPDRWTAQAQPLLKRLKDALFRWAKDFRIWSHWMLEYALRTMFFWTINDSSPDRQEHQDRVGKLIASALGLTKRDEEAASVSTVRRYSWGIGRAWYFAKKGEQQFSYANWQGEDVRKYE
jgi:hypothetical protein